MLTCEKFYKTFFEKFQGYAALVLSPVNRRYLTGFASSDGAVLITPSEMYLIVDFRYYEMAKIKNTSFKVVLADKSFLSVAKDICDREGIKKIAIEDDYVTVSQNVKIAKFLEEYKIEYFGSILKDMRIVKESSEIKYMKEAQKVTDSAFSHILGIINKNMTENDVAAEIEYFFKKNGAECAFNTVCVSGKKSALPHGEPSDLLLVNNSFLTIDFGAKLDGYCSDMTRTLVIGKASDEMKEIYNIVLDAQEAAFKAIRPSVLGSDVDKAARSVIEKNGYGECFGHATGHGLGLDVHENPSFSPNFNFEVPDGCVMSVEPGIYLEGKFGVRIEDVVVVTKDSFENITKSDKKLIEI